MRDFRTRVYSISDFLEWRNNSLLELSPDFQRRSVWSRTAKSYLIDTVVRGKPMPKIIITQELRGARTVRIVVDGQQRLRAILEFLNGDFAISRAHNREYDGFTYHKLPDEAQKAFLQYELGVDVLYDMPYEDILDIFSRINTYTVTLNPQEKRNAKYVGFFKQYANEYGLKYVRYFLEGRILTRMRVTRMAEAELAAELFVALVDGVQTNKNTEQFYMRYEEEPGDLEKAADRFDTVMSYIGEIYAPEDIAQTNWRRPHLFYSLFTAIGHCLYGLGGLEENLRVPITAKMVGKLRVVLDGTSARYATIAKILDSEETTAEEHEQIPENFRTFINQSRRGTTDTSARVGRAQFLCRQLKSGLA